MYCSLSAERFVLRSTKQQCTFSSKTGSDAYLEKKRRRADEAW